MKATKIILTFTILILLPAQIYALAIQDEIVRDNLRLLAHGRIDEVKSQIPDLLAKYPEDPGIKLLHGAILDDGSVAVKIYQNIIEKHADSEWADDAYWRTVQYYAISGELDKANLMLENFRRRYPASPFVAPASDVVMTVSKMLNKTSQAPSKSDIEFTPIKTETAKQDNVKTEHKTIDGKDVRQDFARPMEDKIKTPNDIEPQTNIEPEIIKEKVEEPKVEIIEENHSGFFGLQVGIYRDKTTAETEKEKFLKQRLRTSIEEKTVEGETMYAVVIGHYSSIQSAEAAKLIVKRQCGCDPVVYKK